VIKETSNKNESSKAPFRGFGGLSQCIILAGGLGTRLREAVPDLPKCIAPVAGRPFLFYVINYLRSQGILKFIFSLGYKHEVIEEYLNSNFPTLDYECVIEREPLGTGGAIKLACKKANEKNVLIVNGDTLFKINIESLTAVHSTVNADCTLALKPMVNFDRYGMVELNKDRSITSFKEKQFYTSGNINGGVYLLNTEKFLQQSFPEKFSFEKDYLEKGEHKLSGDVQDEYFIDIGIPQDFNRAQTDFKKPVLDLKSVDKSRTIFLDRDGVINHEKKNDYILNKKEFVFYEGAIEAIKIFTEKFARIFIVTNQRGIGKGLMTENDLAVIHSHMIKEIEKQGGKIAGIYYCTSLDNKHPDRKPNPGAAFKIKRDFPEVDLSKTIMAGNKLSDMLFARNAGLYSIFTATTNPDTPFPHPDIDLRFDSLINFAKAL
jgi:D-glycero-alpha-D-manno-heptose 1-phosphate guanylyltransferase